MEREEGCDEFTETIDSKNKSIYTAAGLLLVSVFVICVICFVFGWCKENNTLGYVLAGLVVVIMAFIIYYAKTVHDGFECAIYSKM